MSRVLTGKWRWNDSVYPLSTGYATHFQCEFESNGQAFIGIRFHHSGGLWNVEYDTGTDIVQASRAYYDEDHCDVYPEYRIMDFGDGGEVEDSEDAQWLLSNITRYGTIDEKIRQIADNEKAVSKQYVRKDVNGNIPLNDDETAIQDRMPVAVSAMAVASYVDDVVDKIGAERMKYYGDADVSISPESLFTFTELDDGTYSIAAKNVWNLSGHIVLPYKYNGKLVTEIAGSGFASHHDGDHITSITGITIPRTIRAINNTAFARNDIPEITIPSTCKTIGKTAFYQSKMRKLVLEEGVEEIGENAFANCSNVTHCVIPSTINSIKANSFAGAGQIKDVYYGGLQSQFEDDTIWINYVVTDGESTEVGSKKVSLKEVLKDWIWQANVYYNYGNDEEVSEATTANAKAIANNAEEISANALAIEAIRTAVSKGMTIKETILYSGDKFYIHPNSFYVAMPPTKDLALYYGDGRADDPYRNYEIGIIGGVSSEVNATDDLFRSATFIQYDGGILSTGTTAIYAYFHDNADEVAGETGAYLQWNGASGTYCPVLHSVQVEIEEET